LKLKKLKNTSKVKKYLSVIGFSTALNKAEIIELGIVSPKKPFIKSLTKIP